MLEDAVVENVPVGFKAKLTVYGPWSVSRLLPLLSYTPIVMLKVLRLVEG